MIHAVYDRRMAPTGIRNAALLAVTLLLIALALTVPRFNAVFIALAAGLLLVIGSIRSVAGGLSRSIEPFLRQPVEIRVWGEPLPSGGTAPCRIESVRALGAGLHLLVSCGSGPLQIKIAQPGAVREDGQRIEIGTAKYVQCNDRPLRQVAGAPAVSIAPAL